MNFFSVDIDSVKPLIGDVTINSRSNPNSQSVITFITASVAQVNAELEAIGTDPSSITNVSGSTYNICQSMVKNYVAYLTIRSRNRGTENAGVSFLNTYNDLRDTLRRRSQRFGSEISTLSGSASGIIFRASGSFGANKRTRMEDYFINSNSGF